MDLPILRKTQVVTDAIDYTDCFQAITDTPEIERKPSLLTPPTQRQSLPSNPFSTDAPRGLYGTTQMRSDISEGESRECQTHR